MRGLVARRVALRSRRMLRYGTCSAAGLSFEIDRSIGDDSVCSIEFAGL
jgi:hypothetical protein